MKLLFLTDSPIVRGAEANLLDILANLDLTKHEIFVVLPGAGPITYRLAGSGIRYLLLPFPQPGPGGPGFKDWVTAVRSAAALARYLKEEKIELVHSNTTVAHLVGGIAAQRVGIPAIWHARRLVPLNRFRGLLEGSATRIIAPWRCVAECLLTQGIAESKVVHISDGIDFGDVVPCPGKVIPEREAIPKDGYVFGMVARNSSNKSGRHLFYKAARRMIERDNSRAHFWLVGNGYHAEMEALPKGRFHVLENREDMGDMYHTINCVVIPSESEQSGRVALEAMCAGRPIIATEVGAHRELLTGEEAILVPPNDDEALAAAMKRMMSDFTFSVELGTAARRRVAKEFAISMTMTRLMELYDLVLASSSQ